MVVDHEHGPEGAELPVAQTSRREFLALGAAVASGLAGCGREPAERDELTDLSATEAIAAMRSGDLSAETYARALLDRCDRLGYLNAFISLDPDQVMEAAVTADRMRAQGADTGPLHGLPVPIKDSVNTRDLPTTAGTRALAGFFPPEDAALVRILRNAGGIVLGKTNIHELSWGWTSNNGAFGPVRNPYDPERVPGGSSGGTAAAVAARMAPLGIAEDTQGSIRVPAALCGVYGFRPTTGRYPNDGVAPITPLFDQVGPHARNVADLQLFDTVVAGEMPLPPRSLQGARIGVSPEYYFAELDREVERVTARALDALRAAGAVLVEANIPGLAELISLTTAQVQLFEVMPRLSEYLARYGAPVDFDGLMELVSPDIRSSFDTFVRSGGAQAVSEQDFIAARDVHLPALRRVLSEYFAVNELAAMVFPATQIPAPRIGQDTEVELNGRSVLLEPVISRNISPGSTAGLPGLVVPVGLTAGGLPIALEFDAPAGQDRQLLALGATIEQVVGSMPAPRVDLASPV